MKTYGQIVLAGLAALVALFTTGCHTIYPANVADAAKLGNSKQYYVVVSTNKDRGFLKEIERDLKARGFVVSSGPMSEMPATTDLYVTYYDHWTWDMVMYPAEVRIAIYDAKTRQLVGSDEFKNSAFHTFPDPPEITDELLGRIFGEPAGKYMK